MADDTFFDARFYARQLGAGERATLEHFIRVGNTRGLDPSPYFSTNFYKKRYPDWQDRGAATALEDFRQRDEIGDLRLPHPLIDPSYYKARYPDLAVLETGIARHFILQGDAEVRSPSAGFDSRFYQRCYLPLGGGRPFAHYVAEGRRRGYLPRPVPRDGAQSAAATRRALAKRPRPFVFCAHDAQAAGVPLLTLDLARTMSARGWFPLFVLGNAGPMLDRFRAIGPVLVLAEGWDLAGIAQGLPDRTPVLVNTAAAATMAPAFARSGHPCLQLIHEMADYLHAQDYISDLQAARRAKARLVASMPRMATALEPDLGPLPVVPPGIILPTTPMAAFRGALRWRGEKNGPVFISAGHADHRKGFDLFLQAADNLREKAPAARFVWLGALDDWAQGLAKAALAKGLDLILPGFVTDSLAWYRAADVYLLTSRQDPGPTTVVHAAGVGTPFVGYAADIGLIEMDFGIGHFIEPGNAEGFAAAALALAASVTPATRRHLRGKIRDKTAMSAYVDSLLGYLNPAAPDVAV